MYRQQANVKHDDHYEVSNNNEIWLEIFNIVHLTGIIELRIKNTDKFIVKQY